MINKNAEIYYQSAIDLLLPAERKRTLDGFRLKLGKKSYFFIGSSTPFNNYSSASLTNNKYGANFVLAQEKIPVPKAICIFKNNFEENGIKEYIKNLKFPLVAKPTVDSARGKDVLCKIKTLQQLENYLEKNFTKYEYISIEEFHGNLNSYRVLVFKKKVLAVVQRYSAHVIGDGEHTIEELIEITNKKRQETNDVLGLIEVDEECAICLEDAGLHLRDIPHNGERVLLGLTSNATRGGTYKSLGRKICKENKELMVKVAAVCNLSLAGIDVECEDINIPLRTSRGVIIEVNSSPSMRIHYAPDEIESKYITKTILRSLIYKHPISYLYILYTNSRYGLFFKIFFSAAILALTYKFLA